MTARRTILRELARRHGQNGGAYTRPGSIAGFEQQPARFQNAVNALLQERLINGTKDDEGRLAIALNQQRIDDVRRELRPWFVRPMGLMLALVAVAAIVVTTWIVTT
jgi:hypothetical protein